jgi:hypothetical protein
MAVLVRTQVGASSQRKSILGAEKGQYQKDQRMAAEKSQRGFVGSPTYLKSRKGIAEQGQRKMELCSPRHRNARKEGAVQS